MFLLRSYPRTVRQLSMSTHVVHAKRASSSLPAVLEARRPRKSPQTDSSTLSNYHYFKVKKSSLNIDCSFETKAISGFVNYNISRLADVDQVWLDTSFLKISDVEIDDRKTTFEVQPRTEPLGSRLAIDLPREIASDFQLKCFFSTTDRCTALQWLEAHQTSGKPYVFSQLEAIHARSLFPCFDTPSIKSPFDAKITSPLPAVFSGIATGNEGNAYLFEQNVPIPAYLIGIASGDLQSASVGPRSKVYTEPFRLRDAQWEFDGDVEKFIQAAESIIFKYEWGTYDILVNPNSYPYGGMESPNMTFATPSLIAYDKSNIDVIAHELAHSWSGNLVTNCSWDHFWLNEGWTVYLERRILGALHGEPARHFSALIGWNDLENSIAAMRNPDRFSTLVQDLKDNTDPDEAFSTVPYEKGFNLLFYIENLVGGPEHFDPFIKHYFTKFARQSLDTWQFLDTLFDFFKDKRGLLENIDWNTWLFTPGMPPKPHFNTVLADSVYALCEKWIENAQDFQNEKHFNDMFNSTDIAKFNSNQLVLFLDTLVQGVPSNSLQFDWAENKVAANALLKIYADGIGNSRNAEVVFRLFRFKLTARLQPYYQKLAEWLGTVGRMKFVRPGYRLLNEVDRSLALATFEKYKDTYHPICRALVKQDLGA
ncbi:LAMI_0E04324g1_1 [Lachancea mirantina]|uniref:Leukotriene A(4) hydrolase n=1 Tax=Lachancea mirantina TaxID=1230905 RepID=A0A1G4JKH7_9SACH|nr:LAMI_0E04324g1_1 [Lachancea mirantina]